jgi:membrane fusion protein, multidrug efflux system
VKAGQVIARLDPAEKQADVRSAEASVSASEAVLRQARANFERLQSLLDRKVATRKDFDAAQESLQTAQSALNVANTQLQTSRETLAYTELTSPRDGIVTASNIEVGQVAQAGQTIFTIAEDGPRDAVFYVDEGALAMGNLAPTITVSLVSDPTVSVGATFREVSPAVDSATGTISVKVELKDPPPAMMLGSSIIGEATFPPRDTIMLSVESLASQGGKPAVWVVDAKTNQVTLRAITVGAYLSDRIYVSGGLADGDIVVSRGGQMLHPGQIVQASDRSAK